jgi:hypothetical protein
MLAVVPLEILVGLRVVLPELLDDVLTHVRVVLLDLPGDLELVLGRHLCHLAALAHQVEHELRDVPPGDRDVLDGAADHVAFGAGDDVRDAVARVDDRARERAVRHAVRGPGRGERQHGLDGDVQPLDVKRLEEDLGRLLAVFRGVQRRLGLVVPNAQTCRRGGRRSVKCQCGPIVTGKGINVYIYMGEDCADQKEVMVLRLGAEVLEDRLFPIPLHVIPVVDLTMADRVGDTITRRLRIGECLVADEEVEVLDAAFRGEMARLCWYCGSRSARLGGSSTSRDGGWKNARDSRQEGMRYGAASRDAGLTMRGRNSLQTWTRRDDEH